MTPEKLLLHSPEFGFSLRPVPNMGLGVVAVDFHYRARTAVTGVIHRDVSEGQPLEFNIGIYQQVGENKVYYCSAPRGPEDRKCYAEGHETSAAGALNKILTRFFEAEHEFRQPAPMRSIMFAEEVKGGNGWLVTLDCGHKKATREQKVDYECWECEEKPNGG